MENADDCRLLAAEGERALREGDTSRGIRTLEHTLQSEHLNDLSLLSAIHSQLGNAYYAEKNFLKARHYYLHDLYASRLLKDELSQAKAYSNLSATYTMLDDFENAIVCANNVVQLGQNLDDKALECRGIYNLGLAHLNSAQKGIHHAQNEARMRRHLEQAVECFEKQVEIAEQRQDMILSGLGIGNLASAYFYMSDYHKAIEWHEKRLEIAQELSDRISSRRTYTNLGNCFAMLIDWENAAKYYSLALDLAREIGSSEIEDQLMTDLSNAKYALRKQREQLQSEENGGDGEAGFEFSSFSAQPSLAALPVANSSRIDPNQFEESLEESPEELFEQLFRVSSKKFSDQLANGPPSTNVINDRLAKSDSQKRAKEPRFSLSSRVKSFTQLRKLSAAAHFHRRKSQNFDGLTASSKSGEKKLREKDNISDGGASSQTNTTMGLVGSGCSSGSKIAEGEGGGSVKRSGGQKFKKTKPNTKKMLVQTIDFDNSTKEKL